MDSSSSYTTAPSALQNKEEAVAMVASPPREEAATASRNVKPKQARLQLAAVGGGEHKPRPQQEKGLKCPRCPSTNTKFCYYNNNSVTQPRFFCKACRRYWTVGGTQRNVPVGGGCRKNKQHNKEASSSTSSSDSKNMNLSQQLMMLPTATVPPPADFPNLLPTFMSTTGGVQLPTGDNLLFTPLPLPSNPAGTTPSFLDMLRTGGGFLDGGSNGMVALPFLLPAPPFAAMLQHGHGMIMGEQLHLQGVDQEVKPPFAAMLQHGHGMMMGDQQLRLQDVDQDVKPPMTAAAGGPSAGGAVQEQQVGGGDDGGSAHAGNNSKGGGASGGSIIDYWQ